MYTWIKLVKYTFDVEISFLIELIIDRFVYFIQGCSLTNS